MVILVVVVVVVAAVVVVVIIETKYLQFISNGRETLIPNFIILFITFK
jgi:hypothetical protein